MIQFFDVGKRFGDRVALADVNFKIPRGQFVFLRGPSGAGKTTLLKLIYRAESPSEGQILVNGRNVGSIPKRKVPFLRRTIGVVFQEFSLIERRTVSDNVTYLPRILGERRPERRRLAAEALAKVGLDHLQDAFPAELSGGEQQRVAIARALISRPQILIADEPTGNLDPELSRDIISLFFEINRQGTTVILATHNPSLRRRGRDRILKLESGRLVEDRIMDPISAEDIPVALGPPDPVATR
ncbi:MAG: ATP-binding cassette domain-containing protein [Acidobacteriota bacterium]|nr:ATP-binding cassette domain-containing protein [Acidobacteriota bacterium]